MRLLAMTTLAELEAAWTEVGVRPRRSEFFEHGQKYLFGNARRSASLYMYRDGSCSVDLFGWLWMFRAEPVRPREDLPSAIARVKSWLEDGT